MMINVFISYNNNYNNGGNYHLEREGGGRRRKGRVEQTHEQKEKNTCRWRKGEREMICSVLYLISQALF